MKILDGSPSFTTDHGVLRFLTAGSVDDGKSTLIGRLIYDSQGLMQDQLAALESASERRGRGAMDLSLLTDGLQAEREQGITIDVAYRYFSTPTRKFIIADAPGHEQYTRNMVTAASTAQVAIILVDVRAGLVRQTRRHTILAHLLGIPHIIFAVNKMDLVDYQAAPFQALKADLLLFASQLGIQNAQVVPLSALSGDGVTVKSSHMPWYEGEALLSLLESSNTGDYRDQLPFRFSIQGVLRPTGSAFGEDWHDFRGFSGRVTSGTVKRGDAVTLLPSGRNATVTRLFTWGGDLEEALPDQSISILLSEDLDLSRGDWIVSAHQPAQVLSSLSADLCWLDEAPLSLGRKYWLKHGTRLTKCIVERVENHLDIHTLSRETRTDALQLNEIGQVALKLQQPIAVDAYSENRESGAFILVDESTYRTVAGGLITHG